MTRPSRAALSSIAAIAASVAAAAAPAQDRPGPVALTTHALRGGAYWVEGGRANTAFIVGATGVVAIDGEMTPDAAQRELAEIARVTPKPVDQIIITHADPDHVAGLPFYPPGAAVIMHENTRSEIVVSAGDPNAPPMYAPTYRALLARLPKQTVSTTQTVVLDGVKMVLMYTGPAHTSGDLMIYLPTQRIVYAGDVITTNTGRFPVIHFGGSSLGWIAAMKAILALPADTYVGGHGGIETRAQLEARLHDAEARREEIKTMVDAGKTLADVVAALPDHPDNAMFRSFTETTYDELARGYPPASPPWTNVVRR